MMLQVKKMSQDLDLEDGSVSNHVLLQLPNGGIIRALVDEEAVQAITNCLVMGERAPAPPPPRPAQDVMTPGFSPGLASDGSSALIFGDDEAPPLQRSRARVIATDEMGFPVLGGGGGVDPGELSMGADRDEDGVGQV